MLKFPTFVDGRGSLSVVEARRHVPFEIERIFYIYSVPGGALRGGHAHAACEQVLIALAGSFDVVLDGERERLDRLDRGLYVPCGVRVDMEAFTPDAVCLVLASSYYDVEDYA